METISGVTDIATTAFLNCFGLTNLTILGSAINIEDGAFEDCPSLSRIYFGGNAPNVAGLAFYADNLTAYYLPGTTGWVAFSANTGFPAVLWNPLPQATGPSFGVRTNRFGFNITGTANIPIVVEACTNLANPVWTPLQSLTLTNGSFYFSDAQWKNYPSRLYRISSP